MNKKPIIAFLYDFDKTLCTTDMQDYAFIPSLGMTPAEFWATRPASSGASRIPSALKTAWTACSPTCTR